MLFVENGAVEPLLIKAKFSRAAKENAETNTKKGMDDGGNEHNGSSLPGQTPLVAAWCVPGNLTSGAGKEDDDESSLIASLSPAGIWKGGDLSPNPSKTEVDKIQP